MLLAVQHLFLLQSPAPSTLNLALTVSASSSDPDPSSHRSVVDLTLVSGLCLLVVSFLHKLKLTGHSFHDQTHQHCVQSFSARRPVPFRQHRYCGFVESPKKEASFFVVVKILIGPNAKRRHYLSKDCYGGGATSVEGAMECQITC